MAYLLFDYQRIVNSFPLHPTVKLRVCLTGGWFGFHAEKAVWAALDTCFSDTDILVFQLVVQQQAQPFLPVKNLSHI